MSKRTVASVKDMRYTISIVKQLLGLGLDGHNVITGYSRFDMDGLNTRAREWILSLDDKYNDATL